MWDECCDTEYDTENEYDDEQVYERVCEQVHEQVCEPSVRGRIPAKCTSGLGKVRTITRLVYTQVSRMIAGAFWSPRLSQVYQYRLLIGKLGGA